MNFNYDDMILKYEFNNHNIIVSTICNSIDYRNNNILRINETAVSVNGKDFVVVQSYNNKLDTIKGHYIVVNKINKNIKEFKNTFNLKSDSENYFELNENDFKEYII